MDSTVSGNQEDKIKQGLALLESKKLKKKRSKDKLGRLGSKSVENSTDSIISADTDTGSQAQSNQGSFANLVSEHKQLLEVEDKKQHADSPATTYKEILSSYHSASSNALPLTSTPNKKEKVTSETTGLGIHDHSEYTITGMSDIEPSEFHEHDNAPRSSLNDSKMPSLQRQDQTNSINDANTTYSVSAEKSGTQNAELELLLRKERNLRSTAEKESESLRSMLGKVSKDLRSCIEERNTILQERNELSDMLYKMESEQQNQDVLKREISQLKAELKSKNAEINALRTEETRKTNEGDRIELKRLEKMLADMKLENAKIKRENISDWKAKYVESCVKVSELIREKRNLVYELESIKEKSREAKSSKEQDLDSLVKRVQTLESRNKNLVKAIAKLSSINWHQDEVIEKLSGPRIKLPSSVDHYIPGSDNFNEGIYWSISANPNISDPSVPEELIDIMHRGREHK